MRVVDGPFSTSSTPSLMKVTELEVSEPNTNPCAPFEYLMVTFTAGGLGNQMSEYASLLAVSSMAGYTPRIQEVSTK